MDFLVAAVSALVLMSGAAQADGERAADLQPRAGVEHDLVLLDHLDIAPLPANYEDARLTEVVSDISNRLGLPVVLDRDSLRVIGVREDDRVTLQAGVMSASALLDALARELASGLDRPTWEVHRGAIVLTSEDATEAMRSLIVYDVRDLVADDDLLGELRATRAAIPAGETEGEEDVAVAADDEARFEPQLSKARELLLIILEHIDPDAWVDMGGSRATITDHQGTVVVTAPAKLHRQFRDALRRLRDSLAESLRVQVHVVDIPRATLDRLGRQYQHEGQLAVALSHSADAAVRWQAVGMVATGSTLALRSASEDKSVDVDVKATYERATGRLRMEIEAVMAVGSDRREASTIVQFQFGEGAAILELPAADVSEMARVVIVRPL